MTNLRTLCALSALLLSLPAMADERQDEINRIIYALEPVSNDQIVVTNDQTNGIEIIVDQKQKTIISNYDYSIDLPVFFALDQSALSEQAKETLSALGEAMISARLESHTYLIAGHTDARGNAAYNQALSLRRAEAVKRFLVQEFGIDPNRLEVFGWGESRLKRPQTPNAPVNRRVEISLVASQVITTSPDVTINIHHTDHGLTSTKETLATIKKNYPTVTIRTSREGGFVSRDFADECERKVAHDPRPDHHNLDDFDSGRTPLKCETETPISRTPNRITIR